MGQQDPGQNLLGEDLLASPWMPEAPPWWCSQRPSWVQVEQLWWDGTHDEFLHSASLAQSLVILHNPSRAPHTTHLAHVCHWTLPRSSREDCVSCLAQLLLGSMALGTGRSLAVTHRDM